MGGRSLRGGGMGGYPLNKSTRTPNARAFRGVGNVFRNQYHKTLLTKDQNVLLKIS